MMNDKIKDEKIEDKSQYSENDKIGVSFYITANTLEKIEEFMFLVKKRLPIEKRRKLTRSVFYEIGLNIAIEDFNKKGEESAVWKAIQEQMSV